MKIELVIVGAGEFTPFDDGVSRFYLRVRNQEGSTRDVDCSESQMREVLQFAVAGRVGAPAPEASPARAVKESDDDDAPVMFAPRRRNEGDL